MKNLVHSKENHSFRKNEMLHSAQHDRLMDTVISSPFPGHLEMPFICREPFPSWS